MPSHASRPALLHAPDGGLPGIPGGESGSSGGLPGIPGAGPSSWGAPTPQPAPAPQSTPPQPGGPASFSRPGAPVQPPQRPVFELASWGSRFGAWIVDAVILGLLFVVLLEIAAALGLDVGDSSSTGSSAEFSSSGGQFLLLILIYAVVITLYAPTVMSRLEGSTLGKRMLGIRVVRADGGPVTFGFAFAREVLIKGILFGFLGMLTIGLAQLLNYLWPLWDSEHRALHDMAARSRVVRR